MAETC